MKSWKLLEKNKYKVKEGLYKNGFHIHFPRIFLSKHDHEKFLIPEIKKTVKSDTYFKGTKHYYSPTVSKADMVNYVNEIYRIYSGLVLNKN